MNEYTRVGVWRPLGEAVSIFLASITITITTSIRHKSNISNSCKCIYAFNSELSMFFGDYSNDGPQSGGKGEDNSEICQIRDARVSH